MTCLLQKKKQDNVTQLSIHNEGKSYNFYGKKGNILYYVMSLTTNEKVLLSDNNYSIVLQSL